MRVFILSVIVAPLVACGSGSSSGGGGGGAAVPASSGWLTTDVGAVGRSGGMSYDAGVVALSSGGSDIWNGADEFRFAWLPLSGDGEITARVLSLDPTDEWAKAGVMIRASLDASAPFAMTVVTPSHGTSFQWRALPGGSCDLVFGPAVSWVRVTRVGDVFEGRVSSDGRTWTLVASRTVAMGVDVLIGLCGTAHNDATLSTSRFDAIGVKGRVKGWAGRAGLTPVPMEDVDFQDSFWAPRIETNRTASIPQMHQALIENHTIDNFAKAAGLMGGYRDGFPWSDGDVYALVEAMTYALRRHPDAGLENTMEGIVGNIVAAQVKSGPMKGYLNTYFQLGNAGRGYGGETLVLQPWEDLIGAHEHVVAGGLLQAGVSHFQTTGRTYLLDAARKFSDHMSSIFGEGRTSGVPGHQGLEHVLFTLGLLPGAGRPSDFEQAKFYLDERGRHSGGREVYGEFCQDLKPIRSETEPLGHCVREAYMMAAATDLVATSGDPALLSAVEQLWTNVVERKMYVTGGTGHRLYNEGYAPDWDLSQDLAYNETCAACGFLFWTLRLANLTKNARYADQLERVLYNGFASGRSIDGTRLYYNNDMVRYGDKSRFGIPCCASNLIRTVPSIPGWQYAVGDGGIWTHLYVAGQANIDLDGRRIQIKQETSYPFGEAVKITVQTSGAFTLNLRIPEWAVGATVNGAGVSPGYHAISKTWAAGDVVNLHLPLAVRRLRSDARVFANRGRAAIARGPLVYCLESPDNGTNVHKIVVPPGASITPAFDGGLLGGVTKLTGAGTHVDNGAPVNFTMIPYGVWDNRNHDSQMRVMVPESAGAAASPPDRGRLADATATASFGGTAAAVHDGLLPANSEDGSIPRFTWWDHKGTEEWIQLDFPAPLRISRSDLYWFNDSGLGGGCDFPSSFRHEYWTGSGWAPLVYDADYDAAVDLFANWHFTIVRFHPVTTTKVRLIAQLKPGKSAGLLEWRLPE
ncbi:MAG TPA: beta-L-arabinofuranosidase domain-containing protein [Planctomycetota bacterium]